jgi:hypothetical protein
VRALTGREHPVAGSAVLAWRLAPLPSLASFAPGPLVSNPCLGAAQRRLSLVAEPIGSASSELSPRLTPGVRNRRSPDAPSGALNDS